MPNHLRFLVVDDNADSRMLLTKTLMRKFPQSAVVECEHGDTAIAIAKTERLDAIVAHRTFDYDGETLIALLRRVNPKVAIVMISGYDRSQRALAAGADGFLLYDAWLQVGHVVSEAMNAARRKAELQLASSLEKPA